MQDENVATGGTVARRYRACARRVRGRSGAERRQRRGLCRPSAGPRNPASARLRPRSTRPAPPTWKRAKAGRWRGSGSPIPIGSRTDGDASRRRRRIAPVARDAASAVRRRQRADASRPDRGSDRGGRGFAAGRRRPHPVRADDDAQPAAFRRPHRGRHMRDPRRHHRRALDDQLRGAGPRLRRRRPQPPAGLSATASIRSSAWSTSRTCSWPTSTRNATAR